LFKVASDEDEEELMMEGLTAPPELNRGYSEQKRDYFKGLSSIIFSNLELLEVEFDFKKLIQEQKEIERRKVMSLIEQRIENFNQAMINFNQAQITPT
jgi:hypothetical protein